MHALKPEPFRPSDAWSGRFFRCLSLTAGKASLEKTAECIGDGLSEGCGLSFLFASFSLDSKEKEGETFALKQKVTSLLCLAFPSPHRSSIRSITERNVRTYAGIRVRSQKGVDVFYVLISTKRSTDI